MKDIKSWPVGIAIVYISFVSLLVTFVIFSSFQKVDLVTENYYEEELKYQQQIERMKLAESLSKPINWIYDKSNKFLTIKFPDELDPIKIQGTILFFRPSDAKKDKLVALNVNSDNMQKISTQNLSAGLWKLKIFWQVDQNEYYKEGTLVIN